MNTKITKPLKSFFERKIKFFKLTIFRILIFSWIFIQFFLKFLGFKFQILEILLLFFIIFLTFLISWLNQVQNSQTQHIRHTQSKKSFNLPHAVQFIRNRQIEKSRSNFRIAISASIAVIKDLHRPNARAIPM